MSSARAGVAAVLLLVAIALSADELDRFSGMDAGDIGGRWQLQTVRGRAKASFQVGDDGVVEARATAAVASLVHPVDVDPATRPHLSWSWRIVDRVEASALHARARDDFPARVYVLFDYDVGRLAFGDRWKLRFARLIYGRWVPAAALCYVPLDDIERGTVTANAYSDRIRMLIVDGVHVGDWRVFERDVVQDFEAAFGEPAPRIVGIAVAIDTDDTGETARTWFGDLVLGN